MPTIIVHRGVRIVTLDAGESIAEHCRSGDIALAPDGPNWWTHFVGDNGTVDSYDEPYDSYNKSLWAAKAAAEMGV
jgi:hypothetical protein